MSLSAFVNRLARAAATPALQPAWENLLQASIRLVNVGSAGDPRTSGEIFALATNVSAGDIVVDVGANRGMFAKLALDRVPGITVHAIEPQPDLAEALRKSQPHLIVHEFAAGDASGSVTLSVPEGSSEMATLASLVSPTALRTIRVRMERLDTWADRNGISEISYLKMDLEGWECAALGGLSSLLSDRRIRAVQFEHGSASPLTNCSFLRKWLILEPQFTIHRILPRGLRRVPAYDPTFEIARTANYLALLK